MVPASNKKQAIGDDRPQTLTRKRPRHSVGESDDLQTVDECLGVVDKALKVEPLQEILELDGAKAIVTSAKTTVKLVNELKADRRYEGMKVQALSFSAIKTQHLMQLGIEFPWKASILPFKFIPAVERKLSDSSAVYYSDNTTCNLDMKRCTQLFWAEIKGTFLEDLEDILLTTGSYTEARSRMIIDLWIQKITRLIRRKLKGTILIHPELRIATNAKDNYVKIEYEKNLTVLTGSVDYAILCSLKTVPSALKPVDGVEIRKTANLEELTDKLYIRRMAIGEFLRIFLVEAKKFESDAKLKDCEPQVIAECTATMHKSKTNPMTWCLTDGISWIFGVVRLEESTGLKEVYQTNVFKYNTAEEEGGFIKFIPKTLTDIFSVLVLWATTPAREIFTLFRETLNRV